MTAYYNEFDPFAAQWLRNLIAAGHIAPGVVDDRSITDVTASDLKGFTQCHFFAGIGGWSLALRLAGVPDTYPLWTGSPPCQPFSLAGLRVGKNDPRHLAPAFLNLIGECKPARVFGEQVRNAVQKDNWIDSLFIEMSEEGYSCGFAVLPSAGYDAKHKRERITFGATLGYGDGARFPGQRGYQQIILSKGRKDAQRHALPADVASHVWSEWKADTGADGVIRSIPPGYGKAAYGISSRVGRLCGYGNAIVPQVVADFVTQFLVATGEAIL